MLRDWTLGRSVPVLNFLEYPRGHVIGMIAYKTTAGTDQKTWEVWKHSSHSISTGQASLQDFFPQECRKSRTIIYMLQLEKIKK